ncbi:MAG TPA: hypothetical protein VNC22_14680 [Sporichthya sp.]|nr:hypothetical protein [Sporichthya sp.]
MGEMVVRGIRLPLRTQVLVQLTERVAERTGEDADRAVLTRPAAQMSLSLDTLEPEQISRIARALVVVADELRRPYSAPGASQADVETAAQLAAIGMMVRRAYGL